VLSRNNPAATETPASYTSTGSPAPVCLDVTGRPPILISQCSDSKSATDYTSSSGRFIQALISSSTWSVILETVSRDTLAP
jgi:hypothetical protein